MTSAERPTLAVIGGSGFYEFLDDVETVDVETPYGAPSAPVTIGEVGGRRVAFLPRHGKGHAQPPHAINVRANIWALRSVGVRQVFAPCAVGGLQQHTQPGTLVVPDQLVDRTTGRVSTFVETGALHIPFADPYCPQLRGSLLGAAPDAVDGGAMVVIEGPRFSTRAESRWYAAQGWSLVNMTGLPEAALAREMGLCYAAIALVTDVDAGVSAEDESVSMEAVFAMFAANIDRLKGLIGEAVAAAPRPGPCGCNTWMDGLEIPYELPVKVLLTGASGFIGSAIRDLLDETGHEVVAVDALIPQAHGEGTVPDATVHRLDVREADSWVDLLRGVDVVCHQSAMVGAGVTVSDMPLYASHNDLGTAVLLAAMEEAGVKRLVFASSMVVYGEGRYVCETHGHVLPGVRTVADLEEGRFDNPCPTCGQALGWELVDEDARLDPRSSYAASKLATEHYASAWVRQADARAVGLRYHNVYGARMPRDTPYSGVAAIFRSSLERGEAPRVFEDGGQMRDFVHVTDVARANLASIEAVTAGSGDDALAAYEAFNVCSGEPVSIRDVAQMLGAASGIEPVVTGQYRLGDVRHVVASPERARQRLGFNAEVMPAQGLAAFVHEPLRT